MGRFTKGPYSPGASSDAGLVVWAGDKMIVGFPGRYQSEMAVSDLVERKANRRLTLAAFNAATTIEAAGYDGQAAIEALPEMVEALSDVLDDCSGSVSPVLDEHCQALLSRIRRSEP